MHIGDAADGEDGEELDCDDPDEEDLDGGDPDAETFDGAIDGAAEVNCPYCGETTSITLDPGSGAVQDYVEDCEVCCRPWRVMVRYDRNGGATVSVDQSQ